MVERLVELGAWRSLADAEGRRPVDIAAARGHDHLRAALAAPEQPPVSRKRWDAWNARLEALIRERTERLEPVEIRPMPTELLEFEDLDLLELAYPGMYGGFFASAHRGRLMVESWSRVAGGSGQAHVITEGGTVLVEEGFV